MNIDFGLENITFDRKIYDYTYEFRYHECGDRITVYKPDMSEKYIFDMNNHKDENGILTLAWGMPRSIFKDGKLEESILDPDIWEFLEDCGKDGPLFANTITGAMCTKDYKTGKVTLLSRGHSPNFNPIEATRRIIKVNQTISNITKSKKIKNKTKVTDPELKARCILRDIITEREWYRYLARGYILFKGISGNIYQIFANHQSNNIKVFTKNKHIYDLCIHSEGVPDTDHVLTCMLLIQSDEEDFIKQCNKSKAFHSNATLERGDIRFINKPLSEILKINKQLAEKLKIPIDWEDKTKKHKVNRNIRRVEEVNEAVQDILEDDLRVAQAL